ncbi:MAG: GNAT family N-acetyltransferase [Bdellovibrionota bacterium]
MNFDILHMKNIKSTDNTEHYIGFRKMHVETFGEESTLKMEEELPRKRNCHLWIAYDISQPPGERVLGFKLGYEMEVDEYYSWRGSVSPKCRKTGIGSALMIAQHDWCKEMGYKRIQTRTRNQWKDMLILNLKHGFNISGTILDENNRTKIILEKDL